MFARFYSCIEMFNLVIHSNVDFMFDNTGMAKIVSIKIDQHIDIQPVHYLAIGSYS